MIGLAAKPIQKPLKVEVITFKVKEKLPIINQGKDELLVKLFAGHLVSQKTIFAELQNHRTQHLERLSEYRDIEQQLFQNPQTLPPEKRFPYLTLRMGIRYETEWLAWCNEVMEFLGS